MGNGYDPLALAELDDPYPAYRELRAAGPLVPGGPGTWAVTGHADVSALLTDARLSHAFPDVVYQASGEPDVVTDFFRATVLNRDAPTHTRLRRAMSHLLGPRAVADLEPRIGELVRELFATMAEQDTADAVAGLAHPLPVIVASELLGIPPADRDLVRPYATALSRGFGAGIAVRGDREETAEAVHWLRAYVGDLLRSRLGAGDGPLAELLATGDTDPEISRTAVVDNVIFLFFAGFETTTHLIANACAQLLRSPALLSGLRARPESAAALVEECLRHDAPIQVTARVTREPVTVGGRTVRARRLLLLLLGSANHDERQFPEPERFDPRRSPNPHLSFSGGPHFCLGARLARMEATCVLSQIATGTLAFAPAGEAVRRRHQSFRGYEQVPVRVRTRATSA